MASPQAPYEYWNMRLMIIFGGVIAIITLDIYAAQNHITILPISVNGILSIVGVVLSVSAHTRGRPPDPPKST